MTREDAIKRLKLWLICSEDYTEDDVSMNEAIRIAINSLEQEPKIDVLDKIRDEISEYGSIWVEYKITGRKDKDIEQLVSDVLKQAKEQVLDVIDKYKAESEDKGRKENDE